MLSHLEQQMIGFRDSCPHHANHPPALLEPHIWWCGPARTQGSHGSCIADSHFWPCGNRKKVCTAKSANNFPRNEIWIQTPRKRVALASTCHLQFRQKPRLPLAATSLRSAFACACLKLSGLFQILQNDASKLVSEAHSDSKVGKGFLVRSLLLYSNKFVS